MEYVAISLIAFGLFIWTVLLYERRIDRIEQRRDETIGKLRGDLERERAGTTTLLRQLAGIDPTPEQQRADLMAQLGAGQGTTVAGGTPVPAPPGPVPVAPSRWEFPPEHYTDDPTDLTQPLDAWVGIDAPDLTWDVDTPLSAPEPVPEGEMRQRIVGMAPDENPLEELGIEPAWREG